MNILVTLNANYLLPLRVMLKSLFVNNPTETFTIYLLHSSLTAEEIGAARQFAERHGSRLEEVYMEERYFKDAPVLLHYTQEMYYRLLAFRFLPRELDRILYLDPDILAINPVRPFYESNLDGYLYAAAYHDMISVYEINKLRLTPYKIEAYYNSGVLLMNLEEQRRNIREEDIFEFVEKNRAKLIMPDQDILNALYSKYIKSVDEKLYNYDVRHYGYYKLMSNGLFDMDHVMKHTVFLHFCGKKKPWKKGYSGKFYSLYKHYEVWAARDFERALI